MASDHVVTDDVSRRMKSVKRRDTAPEMIVRRALFHAGYRYRIHRSDLPGEPDIVFPSRRKIIFVHGCFWHGHAGCGRASLPRTRVDYWSDRVRQNQVRDARVTSSLESLGWTVYVVWECQTKRPIALMERLTEFLDDIV